jgi:hypothetical protein
MEPNPLRDALAKIFTDMGEEWVQTGQHYIALKSGGEINLRADAYPIINLSNGYVVIIDLYGDLPEDVASLIESAWENYRIVVLDPNDDVKTALQKILPECEFSKVRGFGESYELEGDVSIMLTADWIIEMTPEDSDRRYRIALINLLDEAAPRIPALMRQFLDAHGIQVIEYPFADEAVETPSVELALLDPEGEVQVLIKRLLDLAGQTFETKKDLPVYKGEKFDFNLTIQADYYFERDGKPHVIDITGLGSEIGRVMEEHQIAYLNLAGDPDPMKAVPNLLAFLGVPYDGEPHFFKATEREDARNIRFIIPGITFQDKEGRSIFATHKRLPEAIMAFLIQQGFTLMDISLS